MASNSGVIVLDAENQEENQDDDGAYEIVSPPQKHYENEDDSRGTDTDKTSRNIEGENANSDPACNTRTRNENEEETDNLKKDLNAHFSDPYTRARTRRTLKDCVGLFQSIVMVLKLIIITSQLVMFATDRMEFVTFLQQNSLAMRHLLLKNWDSKYETPPYPPSQGPYAIYHINELLDHIHHTLNRINDIPALAVGPFFLASNDSSTPVSICLTYFKNGSYDRASQMLSVDDTIQTDCRDLSGDNNVTDFGFKPSIEDLIRSPNGRLVRLLYLSLRFVLVSVHLHIGEDGHKSECLHINGEFQYNNRDISGQILVDLVTEIKSFNCQEDSKRITSVSTWDIIMVAFSCSFSLASFVLSIISFVSSIILNRRVSKEDLDLNWRAIFQIVQMRELAVILGDFLTIVGSIMKVLLESKGIDSSDSAYDICAVCLGSGCLCVWWTMLHYFSYYRQINLLFEVVEKSALTILSFVLCAGLLFIGFGVCGWAVLGPYHIKFASAGATFQSMMGTLNGDEIYVTMNSVSTNHSLIWIFNVTFHTLFIVVFTLITLNVFIAILTSGYEHLRKIIHESEQDEQSEEEKQPGQAEQSEEEKQSGQAEQSGQSEQGKKEKEKKRNPIKGFLDIKERDTLKTCRLRKPHHPIRSVCCCCSDRQSSTNDNR